MRHNRRPLVSAAEAPADVSSGPLVQHPLLASSAPLALPLSCSPSPPTCAHTVPNTALPSAHGTVLLGALPLLCSLFLFLKPLAPPLGQNSGIGDLDTPHLPICFPPPALKWLINEHSKI